MNKKIVISIVVLLLIVIAGVAFLFMGKQKTQTNQNTSTQTKQTKPISVFSSIQDALSKNLVLQCNIETPKGQKTTTYIKAGKVRVDVSGKTATEATNIIIKDNKMYFWNAQGGFIMEFNPSDIEKSAANSAKNTQSQNAQSYLSMIEKYKDSCKPASVSDSLFVPPANITFQDLSKLMKSTQTETGVNGSNGVNQAQIEEMMKQYKTP